MAGIYVHVPFCRHRCGYCDFPLVAGASDELIDRYVRALHTHVARTADAGPPDGSTSWPTFDSVFVGGGTPTLLDADVLAGIVTLVRERFGVADDVEITAEANPENLDAQYLATVRDAGLNRVSIGAQSFSTRVLDFLDRAHDPASVPRAVEAARTAGIASVSVDLIYAAPAETPQDWEATLSETIAMGPDHVSCYALTMEPNTPYASNVRRGVQAAPDEDVQAERMATADATLAAAGFVRYEVSNWARPDHASRHNQHYWEVGDYLGLGAGAHGHWRGRRWWNLRSPARYAAAVEAGQEPVAGSETVTSEQVRIERLMLGLRTLAGVERAAVEPVENAVVERLVAAGLVVADTTVIRPTQAGLAVADWLALELAG